MSAEPNCPCEAFVHPRLPSNPPGRDRIDYRAGDFASFREALLRARDGETALAAWKPGGDGDLAVQIVEWWAYVADVLTFYNERVASNAFLRTAETGEAIAALVDVLGYRPRPGLGATGTLAALLTRPAATTIPAGLQVQSKPGPGKQPQVFEVDAATAATAPAAAAVDPAPSASLVEHTGGVHALHLTGLRAALAQGDRLLLVPYEWSGASDWALATVGSVSPVVDARGRRSTRVELQGAPSPALAAGAAAEDYRVMRSTQTARAWTYTTADGVALQAQQVDLETVRRDLRAGDLLLAESSGASSPSSPQLLLVGATSEQVWYANAASGSAPQTPPATPAVPVPIPHTRVGFPSPSPSLGGWTARAATTQFSFGFTDVGTAVPAPAAALASSEPVGVVAAAPDVFPSVAAGTPVLLEDSLGAGVSALASPGLDGATLELTGLSGAVDGLAPPFRLLFDLLAVTRGATVAPEVLGSGDGAVAGQEFVLKKAPLTYVASGSSSSGDGYASTLRVFVDGIEWSEARSFFGRGPDDRVFVLREDAAGKTHVLFGDGVNGARLPTGVDNVVAHYRIGSGGDLPAAGTLTVVAKPFPNVRGFRNPVQVAGGADPDPADDVRRYAPRSILTFGRAVSADDYETVAAQAPGVARARADWVWDAAAQRARVTVYVGDDGAAVTSARAALAAAIDPNRGAEVLQATPLRVALSLTAVLAADRAGAPDPVLAAVRAALLALLGGSAMPIGGAFFESRVAAAAVDVPGVVAAHAITVEIDRGAGLAAESGPRFDPGGGAFFVLVDADLTVSRG